MAVAQKKSGCAWRASVVPLPVPSLKVLLLKFAQRPRKIPLVSEAFRTKLNINEGLKWGCREDLKTGFGGRHVSPEMLPCSKGVVLVVAIVS